MEPVIIGVAGGTGSGKTTVARAILDRAGTSQISLIQHDAYYKDLGDLPLAQRAMRNFDHPDALDNALLISHLKALKAGRSIEMPIYDFTTHTRTGKTQRVKDTQADIRFIRRLQRDIAERGRTMESVVHQYLATVRPMHEQFVEPSKRYCDIIIPEGGFNEVAMDLIAARIKALLE